MELKIEVQTNEVRAALAEAKRRLQDTRPLLQDIGAKLESNIKIRFILKQDPDGVPWQKLADSTLEIYARADKGARKGSLLERSGEMLASLESNLVGQSLEVGFGVEHAKFHVTGSRDGKLPRRDPLFSDWQAGTLGAGDTNDVLAEVERYLAKPFGE